MAISSSVAPGLILVISGSFPGRCCMVMVSLEGAPFHLPVRSAFFACFILFVIRLRCARVGNIILLLYSL